jgi:hypothetical protein
MATHVKVSRAVHDMLKEKKDELGVRSVDAVIQHFLAGSQDEGEEESPSSSAGEDADEPVKRRKINVREPLYTLEILCERPGMLEYYTGFDRAAVDLLIGRFSEVGLGRTFFPLLLFRQEATCGSGARVLLLSPSCRSSKPTLQRSPKATKGFESWIWRSES